MSFISIIIYLRTWFLSFGISNFFWDFPLFGLGGSLGSSLPKRIRKLFSLKKKKFKDKEYERYPYLAQESQFK